MHVSIIVVTWNSRLHLPRCLESIRRQTYRDYDLTVIDNASQDGSPEFIQTQCPGAVLIRNKENTGFAKACNQGIIRSHAEAVLILNPDVFPEPTFLEELVTFLAKHPRYGAVGGKLLLYKEGVPSRTIDSTGLFLSATFRARDRGNLEEDRGQYDREGTVFAVCGAAALFRRTALEQAVRSGQYFDEDFFAYYEDLDLGWRLRQAGFESGYTPRAVAFHVRGGSAGEAKFFRKDPWRQRLTMRNRYFMLVKNLTWSKALVSLPLLLLTEAALFLYCCTRARHLLSVYGQVSRNLTRLRKKRLSIKGVQPSP